MEDNTLPRSDRGRSPGDHLVGEDLRAVVIAGPGGVRAISGRRRRAAVANAGVDDGPEAEGAVAVAAGHVEAVPTERLLTHPPRPRKKKRR